MHVNVIEWSHSLKNRLGPLNLVSYEKKWHYHCYCGYSYPESPFTIARTMDSPTTCVGHSTLPSSVHC